MRLCTAFSSDAPSTSNALLPLASTQDSFDEVVLKCSPTSASYYIARTWFKLKVVLQ